MNINLFLLALIQSCLLCGGQVFLKIALTRMEQFAWTWHFFGNILTNWWFLGCGLCYGAGTILWMYIIKHFPFSMAYPMVSLSYVLGMFAAIIFFHEQVSFRMWIGVALIMAGCFLVAR